MFWAILRGPVGGGPWPWDGPEHPPTDRPMFLFLSLTRADEGLVVYVQARSMLARAQDGALPDHLITALQDVPGDTDCIQLLVCRASPLLRGMQRSLRQLLGDAPDPDPHTWASLSPLRRMYHYIPARSEFVEAASSCAQRLPSCSQLFAGFDK